MIAYHIDATARTVTAVEYDGNYRSIYPFLGPDALHFDVVSFGDDGDGMYCDGEALLRPNALLAQPWFAFGDHVQPYAGSALILGCDEDGHSTAPVVSLDAVRERVRFIGSNEVLRMLAEYDKAIAA